MPPFSEAAVIQTYFERNGPTTGLMIDVGAHFGESFAPYANLGWRIIAFEPDPCPSKQESLQSRASAKASIELLRVAVSDVKQEDVDFFASDVSTGISSLSAFHDSHRKTATVETDTLENLLRERNVQSIDYLKIDTEGNDLMVLQGHDWRIPPGLIMCEFEDSKTRSYGYRFDDLTGFLVSKGYRLFVSEWWPIVAYGTQHRWRAIRRFPCRLEDRNGWGNIVAIRPENAARFEASLGNLLSGPG
ncbi:MAG: FkbM family methyltransferase [Planctomycetota bacterium]